MINNTPNENPNNQQNSNVNFGKIAGYLSVGMLSGVVAFVIATQMQIGSLYAANSTKSNKVVENNDMSNTKTSTEVNKKNVANVAVNSEVIGIINSKEIKKSDLPDKHKLKAYEVQNSMYSEYENILVAVYLEEHFGTKNDAEMSKILDEKYKSELKITDDEAQNFYNMYKTQQPDMKESFAEIKDKIKEAMIGRKRNTIIGRIVSEAKAKGDIKMLMLKPTEPEINISADDDPIISGNKDAKITMIEFADYECPYCAKIIPVLEQVAKKYPNDVKWVYRDFPLSFHPNSKPAAIAANCAGEQNKYKEMFHKIYESLESGKKLGEELYLNLAKEFNLNIDKFVACQKNPSVLAEIEKDFADGSDYGVNGTPSVFINGKKVQGYDLNVYVQAIEEAKQKLK